MNKNKVIHHKNKDNNFLNPNNKGKNFMNHNNNKDIKILKNNYKENNTLTKGKVFGNIHSQMHYNEIDKKYSEPKYYEL